MESCDASSNHLNLREAIILKVYGPDPHNLLARSELLRRAEKATINMHEVKEVRFIGINLTRDGI